MLAGTTCLGKITEPNNGMKMDGLYHIVDYH